MLMRKTDFERFKTPQPVVNAQRELGESYVYLVACGDFVKIGLAADPQKRLAMMQTGNPIELTIIKVWHTLTPQIDEECLHAQYEKYRVRGEWFKIPQKQLALLTMMPDLSPFRV